MLMKYYQLIKDYISFYINYYHGSRMSIVADKKFEFPGSILHFAPRLKFTIVHMYLKISPNFEKKQLLNCKQKLKFKALQDIQQIILDIAELKINKVSSNNIQIEEEKDTNNYQKDDKLRVKFKNIVKEKTEFEVEIDYSCGYYSNKNKKKGAHYNSPRSGFHFIAPDQFDQSSSAYQSWTQGETMESRYWFPCIDDPQVKFTREIEVIAPDDEYLVISNGTYERKGNIWKWNESTPNPAYLTSVVIGKFSKQIDKKGKVPLEYYWPTNIPKNYDPMLTFGETPKIIKFFEQYLETNYPYEKYGQIAVEKFEFGGMENTNCTTLTSDILHDKKASLDYSRDIIIVAHELAHQWFGDLITCKDWSHIWLNEGFATYFEVLYGKHKKHKFINRYKNKNGNDQFLYKIIQMINNYYEEANSLYKRPIVTKLYKHPDELFDSHSYEKGGLVLYMLNNLIGEENFKKTIKKYLDTYRESIVTTEDFQKICEDIYGEDLQQFFKQWLYTAGHPELEIIFSLIEENNQQGKQIKKIKSKITQIQKEGFEFTFPLELRIVCSNIKKADEDEKIVIDKTEVIEISKKETDYTFKTEIPMTTRTTTTTTTNDTTTIIKWISIDPQLKILKEIKSITIVNQDAKFNLIDILKNQLENNDIATIPEKIGSLQLLKDCYSKKTVELLKNVILQTNSFYGIAVEAANVLGSYHDKKNFIKDNDAYYALEKCITNSNFLKLAPQIKRTIIKNIGLFERENILEIKKSKESNIPLLVSLLDDNSYFVENAAATAIGKSIKNLPDGNPIKDEMIQILKDKVLNSTTFQDQLAQGAITGLGELANDANVNLVQDIAELLIRKSSKFDFDHSNHFANRYFIRSAATLTLGKFLASQNEQVLNDKVKKEKIDKINKSILYHLLTLLKDERRRVKINACTALADKDAKVTKLNERIVKSIEALQLVAEEDVDGFVRRNAEVNLNLIREWLKEWTDTAPKLEIKIRKEVVKAEGKGGVSKMKDEKDEVIGKRRKDENKEEKEENDVKRENDRKYEEIQRAARKERLEY
jgi:aminopeptidase N